MAEPKTKKTNASAAAFLKGVDDEQKRRDCRELAAMMKAITGQPPKMWGDSIVGFGSYRYKYASGHEGEWFVIGFSPRKRDLTLYIMAGFDRYAGLMKKLGKYKTGKCCLHVKKLDDVDRSVLQELATQSVKDMKRICE